MTIDQHLNEIKGRVELAHRHICDLAAGKKKFGMSIPPQSDDSDMTLQAPLDDISRLVKALEVAEEHLGLIVIQRENFPEDAAENSIRFASEALKEIADILKGSTP